MAIFIEKPPVTSSNCYETMQNASILIQLGTFLGDAPPSNPQTEGGHFDGGGGAENVVINFKEVEILVTLNNATLCNNKLFSFQVFSHIIVNGSKYTSALVYVFKMRNYNLPHE
jgi:hypothetical protein